MINPFQRGAAALKIFGANVKPQADAQKKLERSARELATRSTELDRRESVLNARLAAFEAAMRRHAEDACFQAEGPAANVGALAAQAEELGKIADALEIREKKISQLTANLRARETELEQKTRAIQAREEELERKRAENEKLSMRLVAARNEMDEKERLFEERSQQALDSIRRQKDELLQLRKAA